MNLISINIHDPNNLGDQVCNPCDYFPELKNVPRVDAWDWPQWVEDTEHDIIFGGGGMVHGVLVEALRRIKRVPNRKLIAWGLGHNQHGETTNDYAGCLDGFDLIGVRDYKRSQIEGWEYVPCPSCLHEAFRSTDNGCPINSRFMTYQHKDHPFIPDGIKEAWVSMSNNWNDLKRVVDQMKQCPTVITNSYHGAYWAMLLLRNTYLFKPFSSRFVDFERMPKIYEPGEYIWNSPSFLGFMELCTTRNTIFYEKVKQVLGIHDAGNDHGAGDHRDPVPAASVGADRRHAEGAD